MYKLADRLFPICRSITGAGVRETFDILKEYIPDLLRYEVPTGTKVMDWTVPKEWKIEEAYIEDETGRRIIDFKDNNFNGEGVLTLSNGKKIKGRFENGKVIRKKSLADIPISTIVNIICFLLILTNFVTMLKYRILKNKMKAISKNSED